MGAARVQSVADGVVRITRAHVNCYLISDQGLTLVDAGLPGMWGDLLEALKLFKATPSDIDAVLLTHGHFDHVGLCRRVMDAGSAPVLVHEGDRRLARHPYRYAREITPFSYPFRYPRALRVLGAMTAAGALRVKGVDAAGSVEAGQVLDVPGHPRVVFSPGHTNGHCAFVLERQGVLFSGDALVTLDPYTGLQGPRVVARAATADSGMALRSLDALAGSGAAMVLPGHGDPFLGDAAAAAAIARTTQIA